MRPGYFSGQREAVSGARRDGPCRAGRDRLLAVLLRVAVRQAAQRWGHRGPTVGFVDEACYLVDGFVDILGAVTEVSAFTAQMGHRGYLPPDVEDNAVAILRFANGTLGVIDSKWGRPQRAARGRGWPAPGADVLPRRRRHDHQRTERDGAVQHGRPRTARRLGAHRGGDGDQQLSDAGKPARLAGSESRHDGVRAGWTGAALLRVGLQSQFHRRRQHPRSGEVSLAHHGVLFLDELPEFRRDALESLRQPVDDGIVSLARASERCSCPLTPRRLPR
jgi:predicted dehydrogenase